MAMTGNGLYTARKAARDNVLSSFTQTSTPSLVETLTEDLLLADSTAIITYITGNAVVTTNNGAPDGEHTGVIT
jgi:hypothetical protein